MSVNPKHRHQTALAILTAYASGEHDIAQTLMAEASHDRDLPPFVAWILVEWLDDLLTQLNTWTGLPFSERWLAELGQRIEEWEPAG